VIGVDLRAGCREQADGLTGCSEGEVHMVGACARIVIGHEPHESILSETDERQVWNAMHCPISQGIRQKEAAKAHRLRAGIIQLKEILIIAGRARHPLIDTQRHWVTQRRRHVS
jgi:hypothetical protein